jgi:hypothetical protein
MGNPNCRPTKQDKFPNRKRSEATTADNTTTAPPSAKPTTHHILAEKEESRCITRSRLGHSENKYFFTHFEILADYVVHFPDSKMYWERQIRKFQATLAAKHEIEIQIAHHS